jgi:cytochrome P450 family 135
MRTPLKGTDVQLPEGPSWSVPVSTARWIARPWATLEACQRQFGDTFSYRIAQEDPWVFTSDPEAVKEIFRGDPRLLHAGEANTVLLPVLGSHSVLLLDEDRHLRQRKLLLPPFHGERMQRYGEIMEQAAVRSLERWPTGTPVPLGPEMKSVTLDVIMRAVFGVGHDTRHERLAELLRGVLATVTSPVGFMVPLLLGPNRAARLLRSRMKPVDEEIAGLIAERRRDEDLESREDILSLLLLARHEDGEPMSDAELRDELMTLLVAGHETTATSLSWAFERLVRSPDVLERLVDEIDAGEDAYLDATIQETLRLRPVISLVLRRLVEPMEIAGRELPAGVSVAPCIYLMHRRPDLYPDPHAFRPERFLETPPGTYTWIPFGGGVRRCIGASFAQFEMKMVLRAVLSRLSLSAADAGPERPVRRAITHVPAHGASVVARPRGARPSVAAADLAAASS